VRWRDATGVHEQRTAEPATFVARLVAAEGGEPQGVEIVRPSLEDIYLGLIGDPAALEVLV
jgi:ABC-2 type transport system ATP-binding protein